MTSGEEPAADQSIERLFLTSSDSEDEAYRERENCKNVFSSERKNLEDGLNDEKKELENKISKERKDSENEMSNEDVDSKDGMSSRGEDLESKTSIEIQDSDDEKLFIDSEGGTYNECEESKSGAWGEGEDWGDEEWEALVASMKANEDLQDNEELNDANSSTGNWFAGTMSESDHEFEVMDIFHRKCYGCFLKKCVKKLGRFGLEKPSSSDEEEVERQICESSSKPATDAELPEVNSETAEDQNLQIDTADSSQPSVIAEDMIPAVSLAEKHEKEIRVEEEHKPEDEDEIEKNDSQVTGSDKEKEKSQEEREMISKIEICRPTSIVPEVQGPRVPKEEQAFVPYTFYSQHSSLTEKEHIHYVAMSLQRASGAAFVHKEDKKKFSTIKEKLTEENEKFNDEVRQLTTAMHKNRYHTLPTSIRSYVQDIFLAKIQRLCRYAPRAYDLAGQCSMDSDVYTQSTPVLEFSKCLLVVGTAPSVQLPNLKRKAIIRYREVAPVSERYPANFHLEKKPITADPNIPLLLEKYNADVVASSSSLKTILADFGPFHSGKYDIPVYIKSCKVKGTLKRVIFLLKPLVSTKLSVPQLLSYIAKYALQMNLLVEPTEENRSGSSVRRGDASLERDEAEEGEDVLKNSAANPANVSSRNPPKENAKPAKKKRRLCSTVHLSKMVEELPGYKNISIGVQKGDKGKRAEENAEEFHQPEMPGRQQCYDLWALKEFTLLVRSNSDGFMRRKDATGIEETCKVSLMPKIEFQPEHGGEVLRAEELRTSYWKLFLKRCNLHVTVRLHYLLDQAIGVETIQPSDFLSKDIYSSRHPWVSDGFNRLHWILRQLSHLDEGAYLLTRDASAHNSFSLYSESADSVNADIRLLDENRERIAINLLDPEDAWLRIDPNVILQWHIIRKHAPAAFDPKETSRGITPLVSVEQKLASGKAGKRKAKTLQSKRRKMRRQKHYANEEMQPMEMAEELPIESDVF